MALPTASDNVFPRLLVSEGGSTATPAAGNVTVYAKADGRLYSKDDAGAETALGAGHQFDYVEITSNKSITATTEATADVAITGSAVTYDGSTVILVEFYSPSCRPDVTAAARTLEVYLYDGASSIGLLGYTISQAANYPNIPMHLSRRLTPSAAAHTYSIRGSVSAGTGAIGAGAGGVGNSMPAFLRISKIA